MAIKTKPGKGEAPAQPQEQLNAPPVSLYSALKVKNPYQGFNVWLVGHSPLIVHAWSQKAKLEMLGKQLKLVKAGGKEKRDPERDFVDSLYSLEGGGYGFPTTGLKKAILSAAHKDKGIAKTVAMSSLWLNSSMVRAKPAYANAICDMPISRIWGSEPVMREDMVKIGSGLNKVASLAYRAQFDVWAIKVSGRFNPTELPAESLAFLVNTGGIACGIGEWRNEKSGVFGSFHMASPEEESEWEAFKAGRGPMPSLRDDFMMAAE